MKNFSIPSIELVYINHGDVIVTSCTGAVGCACYCIAVDCPPTCSGNICPQVSCNSNTDWGN